MKVMNVLDHMKLRLGMYIPVQNDGRLSDGVWMVLLREVVEGAVGAFRAGKVRQIEIWGGAKGSSVSIRCDGVVSPLEQMVAMCNGNVALSDKHNNAHGWYGGLEFALLNVLSERLEVEVIENGCWRKLACGRGREAGAEDCLPMFGQKSNETCVSITPCEDYLKVADESPFKEALLKVMGEAIAIANPGLTVVVNGSANHYEKEMWDILRGDAPEARKVPLIASRQTHCGSAGLSLALVPRQKEGRRIKMKVLLNGWEVRQREFSKELVCALGDWIESCPCLQQPSCDYVCLVEGRFPGAEVWQNGLKYGWSGSEVTFDLDSSLGVSWRNDIKRCWVQLFKEFVA